MTDRSKGHLVVALGFINEAVASAPDDSQERADLKKLQQHTMLLLDGRRVDLTLAGETAQERVNGNEH